MQHNNQSQNKKNKRRNISQKRTRRRQKRKTMEVSLQINQMMLLWMRKKAVSLEIIGLLMIKI
jgi:hypothetical protein